MSDAIGKMKRALRRALQDEASRLRADYPDFDPSHLETLNLVRQYTMTSPERIHALIEAVKYITRRRIPGAVVECGVWRGGSMMAAAKTLLSLGAADRDLYLFDTYEGMSAPTDHDVDLSGRRAASVLAETSPADASSYWCYASLEDVQRSVATIGYPEARVHYVRGKVEQTVPAEAPDQIALLRLDTDWYESTKHELQHLYPRLSSGGVLIIDDYGHWKGSRQATDEFIDATPGFGLLTRIDYTGRLAIKP
ncbi:MAG TPA: TylF/MycF/NovP-related O-methyltransferase [Vicinamibacterales bacterium]|nr:TylF/MycF/NovP-related O-methyltransferase [Vicinamibacterales bacterium]